MTTLTKDARSLPYALADEIQSFGALSILPLFPAAEPRLEYIGLDEAVSRGLTVREVDEAGDVQTLFLANPLDEHVLLYEGEELVGAKQNRIVEHAILVEAHSKLDVRVVCVERGRWSYRTRAFKPAPRAAYPELRRAKQYGQSAVWQEVSAKQARMGTFSPTDAVEDVYLSYHDRLDEYLAAFPRLDGQSGAAVAIGGRVACLDYVGRPDVWAALHSKLVSGYALSALEHPRVELPVEGFAGLITSYFEVGRSRRPKVGLGVESRLHGPAVGSELVHDGELVALSLFPAEEA